ncbi:MAG: hypothetical protein KatS3mg085_452 [Candidatus Dojkabacteria bacterium]|nr:MAG: hypothetical protein KatS3mg085_452 [Candidatus Dojkabacteria bacterium]
MDILNTKSKDFQEIVKNAPKLPGVYLYLDQKDTVLYVGKAKILKNRIQSYFNNYDKLSDKIKQMLNEAVKINYYTVDTEIEALILETNLIKKYRPKYNTLMKDDKNYIFVRFEKIRKKNQPIPTANSTYQDFPKITITRKKETDGAIYFGPYPNAYPVKRVLRKLRKIFPFCSHRKIAYQLDDKSKKVITNMKKPCFYYHIGLCKGACAGLETKEEYTQRYKHILRFFKGEKDKILNDLEKQMKTYARNLEFEKAAEIRNMINDIDYATKNTVVEETFDDIMVEDHLQNLRKNAIDDLISKLNFPANKLKKHPNFRIECYDISNLQGTNATGSMVVQIDGEAAPQFYRKFRIRSKQNPDDFLMLQEVLARRFKRLIESDVELSQINPEIASKMKKWKFDESFAQKPDLIIIDGGKGQISAVYEVLKIFKLDNEIPIIGLAKKNEEIFKIKKQFNQDPKKIDSTFQRIILPKNSESLYLIQRIRDEAHRFAKKYHTQLRSKNLF